MKDLAFDFNTNDLILDSIFFNELDICSLQNAAMIFNKSAASILYPEYGVGFDEFYPNLDESEFGQYAVEGERQVKNDGALTVRIQINKRSNNIDHEVEINARYRSE